MKHIFLNSTPLGTLTNPASSPEAIAIAKWAADCLMAGHILYVPEIIDYEIRRELLRAVKINGLLKLDAMKVNFKYVPITSVAMSLSAKLWADSRRAGFSTGDPKKLDIDVILAAQALTSGVLEEDIIVATSNANHISRFVTAANWMDILP